MPDPNDTREINSVHTTFDILEAIKESDGATVTELAERLGISKGTVHPHLKTLLERQMVVNKNGSYELGLRFFDFGIYVKKRQELPHHARPILERLAAKTNTRAHFHIEEHGRGIVIHSVQGDNSIPLHFNTKYTVGPWKYLHATAGGKAIIQMMSRDRIGEVIDRWGLPQRTENTITDLNGLLEEIERDRERGYSICRSEDVDGQWAYGAPISNTEGTYRSISVSGPKMRIRAKQDEIINELLEAINEFELGLVYDP